MVGERTGNFQEKGRYRDAINAHYVLSAPGPCPHLCLLFSFVLFWPLSKYPFSNFPFFGLNLSELSFCYGRLKEYRLIDVLLTKSVCSEWLIIWWLKGRVCGSDLLNH